MIPRLFPNRILTAIAVVVFCLSLLYIGVECDKVDWFSGDDGGSVELLCGFRSRSGVTNVIRELRDRMRISDPEIRKARLRFKMGDSLRVEQIMIIVNEYSIMGTKGRLVFRFYDEGLVGVNYSTFEARRFRRHTSICYYFGGSSCSGVTGIPSVRGSIRIRMVEFPDGSISIDSEDAYLGKKYENVTVSD